jgi:ubiquinone/menaquinone biosynthesis C-methylase UbiE
LAPRKTLLPRLLSGPASQSLLDLGTGSGQVPASLARAAARHDIRLLVVGVDRKLSHLVIGRQLNISQLRVVAAAHQLPFRNRSFDWSLSNLFFHHFLAAENLKILGQMRRVSRRGAVVIDLRQSRVGRLVARLMLLLLRVGPVARYDGKLSMDQAWHIREVQGLTSNQSVDELRPRFPFRFSLVLPGTTEADVTESS